MAQKRTLHNKLYSSTRKPSLRRGTPNRRVTSINVDAGPYGLIRTFHTTKGRSRWIVVRKAETVEVAE